MIQCYFVNHTHQTDLFSSVQCKSLDTSIIKLLNQSTERDCYIIAQKNDELVNNKEKSLAWMP